MKEDEKCPGVFDTVQIVMHKLTGDSDTHGEHQSCDMGLKCCEGHCVICGLSNSNSSVEDTLPHKEEKYVPQQ